MIRWPRSLTGELGTGICEDAEVAGEAMVEAEAVVEVLVEAEAEAEAVVEREALVEAEAMVKAPLESPPVSAAAAQTSATDAPASTPILLSLRALAMRATP